MKLYLLSIGMNNSVESVFSERIKNLINECNGGVCIPNGSQALKEMISIAFESKEDREKFANEIQDIAFSYAETEEISKEDWDNRFSKSNDEKVIENSCFQRKLEKILKKLSIKYTKEINNSIYYDFQINGVNWCINIGNHDSFINGAFEKGKCYLCYNDILAKKCLDDIIKEIKFQAKGRK